MSYPSMSFYSELSDPVRKELLQLYAQLGDFLRSAGFNSDGSFNNIVVNNITVQQNTEVPGGGAGEIVTIPPAGSSGPSVPFTGAAPGNDADILFNKSSVVGADDRLTWDRAIGQLAVTTPVTPSYQQVSARAGSDDGIAGLFATDTSYQDIRLGVERRAGVDIARSTTVFIGQNDPAHGVSLLMFPNQTPGTPLVRTAFVEVDLQSNGNLALYTTDGTHFTQLAIFPNGTASLINDTHDGGMTFDSINLVGSGGADTPNAAQVYISDPMTAPRALQIALGDQNRTLVFDPSGFVKWT